MDTAGVGVSVLLFNEYGELLIIKRAGAHGEGKWAIPGGRVEFQEPVHFAAQRELEEEVDVNKSPGDFTYRGWADSVWDDPKKGPQHWITLVFETTCFSGTPKIMEPTKMSDMKWVDPRQLHQYELFTPLNQFLDKYPVEGWAIRTCRMRTT